jgi:hypothetical protein
VDNDRARIILLFLFRYSLLALLFASSVARATGEINFLRAPEQIPEGDEITIAISASAREPNIDRTVALEYPANWKFKRAWRVEAGSDHAEKIAPYSEVRALLESEPGQAVIALADYTPDFDPNAAGIAYFVVFSIAPNVNSKEPRVAIKAAFVERASAEAAPQIDPKTKRPLPISHNWRMTFPLSHDFSFSSVTTKRLIISIRMERVPRQERALVVEGTHGAVTPLRVRPELLQDYLRHPFTIAFWFRTNLAEETLLSWHSDKGNDLRLAIGLLGEPVLGWNGKQGLQQVISPHAFCNDGAWHYLVLSNDSLGIIRLFVDAASPISEHVPAPIFGGVSGMMIGDSSAAEKDFSIDELRMERGAFRDPSEFERNMTVAAPDTGHGSFAIFHFDGYAGWGRSSVIETSPIYFALDSFTAIHETTSPVALTPVLLSVELPSPTRVNLHWSRTSEVGVKQYRLELRIGTYGPFEKFSTVDARHGMKAPQPGLPIISREVYSESEELPKLNGNIDLYFRVAIVGFNKKDVPSYSLPVKVEYGSDRDVFVEQNAPEPFTLATQIAFHLTKPELVRLSVFDMIGREVAVLVNDKLDPGRHVYDLDATRWPAGIYFYKVKTARVTITRKMTLIK